MTFLAHPTLETARMQSVVIALLLDLEAFLIGAHTGSSV